MQSRSLLGEELGRLRSELTVMAARVEDDLQKAREMLRTGDEDLAKEVKDSGRIVDELQLKVEDMALVLIATQQPVARDLRELITLFKLTANLERINDYVIHLAKIAKKLASRPPFQAMERIERMAETSQTMLKAAFSAYLSQDIEAAREAAAMDDAIDVEHKALVDEVLALMKENPKRIKSASRLVRLSGFMERLGDHITNMCEAIIFMVKGSHVKLNE